MKRTIGYSLSGLLFGMAALVAQAMQEGQIAPPKVRITDDWQVNLQSRQPDVSQQTLAIGGDLGLSHSISLYTSHFAATNAAYGYSDRYAGNAQWTVLGTDIHGVPGVDSNELSGQVWVMRVFGLGGTQDFQLRVNGQIKVNPGTQQFFSNYTYQALGDQRHRLELVSQHAGLALNDEDRPRNLVWTRPDGTRLYYRRPEQAHALNGGLLYKVVRPNGLTLHLDFGSVTTNTGYQLKYEYINNNQGLSSDKQSLFNSLPTTNEIPPANPGYWSEANPRRIRALNNTLETCPTDPDQLCGNLNRDWPTATFTWPGGMPRAFYLGESVFSVEDMTGAVTEYHFRAYDVMLKNGVFHPDSRHFEYGEVREGDVWSPRLVGVKPASSNRVSLEFDYKNRLVLRENHFGGSGFSGVESWYEAVSDQGEIINASSLQEEDVAYSELFNSGAELEAFRNHSYRGEFRVHPDNHRPGSIREIHIPGQGRYLRERNYRNFITQWNPTTGQGPDKEYHYDSRGNLKTIVQNPGAGNETRIEAGYPSSCSFSNRKICNQPSWVENERGHRTDYNYHAPSGQVAKITEPADNSGVRPQTRYEYQQYYAYYKRPGSNSIQRAESPVWLLSRESYCRTGSASGNGCSGSGDEVVIEYDYGPQDGSPNNLNLRSQTVIADGQSRRTCFQYDIYGHQIGETAPKAGLSQCP